MPPLPRRVLLIQLRRLGDVVLSTALLEHLHAAVPAAQLDYLVGAEAAPLIAGHPLVHERIVFDPDRTLAMWREVRARRYDCVVDVQGSLRTALVARASGAPVRVGWRIRGWRALYTRAHPRGGGPEYAARERARLLELAGVPISNVLPRLHLSADERERGERDARSAGAVPDLPRVALHLSSREAVKDWPADGYGALAAALRRDGLAPLVLPSPGDESRLARVRAAAPDAVVLPVLGVRRLMGVLSTCRALVSGDTGPAHIADALDVPRVTIFGATSPVAWMPGIPTAVPLVSRRARVLTARDRARYAGSSADFTSDVTPADVLAALRTVLSMTPARSAAAG